MTAPMMPSQVDAHVGLFDRFAARAAAVAARAPFFAVCVLLVVVWLAQGVVRWLSGEPLGKVASDSVYQLEINTTTTIITFLMVALLQNSQTRTDAAVNKKLNALADGLGDLMAHIAASSGDPDSCAAMLADVDELRSAVGLEHREST